jgi:hypothetical protein
MVSFVFNAALLPEALIDICTTGAFKLSVTPESASYFSTASNISMNPDAGSSGFAVV